MRSNYDFCGWATRNDIKCSDGRTIRRDAFAAQDGATVPIVFNHQHSGIENVLGHGLLENRKEGVYVYGSLNDSPAGQDAKEAIRHGDIVALSIYANQLKQNAGDVIHGTIREVSLVMAGANPGAMIEHVMMHSEDGTEMAIIHSGMELELIDDEEETEDQVEEPDASEEESSEEIAHAEEGAKMAEEAKKKETTVEDVLGTFSEDQMAVVEALVGAAIEDTKKELSGGKEDMKHNLFDPEEQQADVLMHNFTAEVIADAKRNGSLKDAVLAHAESYGITDIDMLFPDYRKLENEPGFIKRTPDEWVAVVMNGVHHTPFSRIKMVFADITADEARAKGYVKGNRKEEEVFGLLKRTVDPTTIYKKQKLDRDDILDITDFNVVSWLKGEMRMMLEEEIARAIVFGDGRTALSADKISDSHIIPIVKDNSLYAVSKTVTVKQGETAEHALITAAVKAQDDYQGSGNITLFLKNTQVTSLLLEEDKDGHRMYKNLHELALAMNVDRIVKVPASIVPADVIGVMVDLKDYNVGADKGGNISMFDDFDIDYNQYKYLMETRCSGALTKPYSAIVLKEANAAG